MSLSKVRFSFSLKDKLCNPNSVFRLNLITFYRNSQWNIIIKDVFLKKKKLSNCDDKAEQYNQHYDDIFWARIRPIVMSRRIWQGHLFILWVPPAHSGSALNCRIKNISKTHSILHFIPQTHQRTASSFCKLHFPREKATSPKKKPKAQCHHPGIWKIPESLSFITKIVCEHKQMWGTNMPFIWEGRWSHSWRDSSEKGLWKTKRLRWPRPSICAALTGRQALGLEPTRLKQKSSLLLQRDTQSDRFTDTSCTGFRAGKLFIHLITTVVFVLCFFCWQLLEWSHLHPDLNAMGYCKDII